MTACYNPEEPGVWCEDCKDDIEYSYLIENATACPIGGVNPVNMASGDVQRAVNDLAANGGAGQHRLHWTRYGHSRLVGGANWFGDGHCWRHSYQWEMTEVASGQIKITDPRGTAYVYQVNGGGAWESRVQTGYSNWVTAPSGDVLTQSGTNYSLTRKDGSVFHFAKLNGGSGDYFQLQNFGDGYGQAYALSYDSSKRLVLVSEPAGRWLRISYAAIATDRNAWTNLATISPPSNDTTWVEQPFAAGNFRYLRYYSTDPSNPETSCNVAEIEFWSGSTKLTGTPFGASPAWSNLSNTFDKAHDGNTSTFYDYAYKHFGFTGLDLGSANTLSVDKVRVYPRATFASRLTGRVEGSNTAPITQTVISKVETGYGSGTTEVVTQAVDYQYKLQADSVLPTQWLLLEKALYADTTQAYYTYQIIWPGQRPLLETMDDVRGSGAATRIKYEFWKAAYIHGALYAERHPTTNTVLAKLVGEGSGDWDAKGRKMTYATGRQTRMEMDGNYRMKWRENGNGHRITFAYDAGGVGNLTASTISNGTANGTRTTSYTRDAVGRLLSVTLPGDTAPSRVWTRDSAGRVLTERDELSRTTTYTRDGSGRVTRADFPDSTYETFTYNTFGQITEHRRRNAGIVSTAYDTRCNRTSATDAVGKTTTYTYNAQDLVATVTDALSRTTSFEYNERGQTIKITHADTSFALYAYDEYGNRITATNELGKSTTAVFDEFKRKTSETDALNRTTQFGYDEPAGGCGGCGGCGGGGAGAQLTTVTSPGGKKTRFAYDAAGQRTAEIAGYETTEAATTQYVYDLAGRLIQRKSPRLGSNGQPLTWSYTYDVKNRQLTETDPHAYTVTYAYDAVGNRLSESRPHLGGSGVTTWLYDAMNRRTRETNPLGYQTNYTYTALGLLASLTDAKSNAYTFDYDAAGRKTTMTYPGASYEAWTYDDAGSVATYRNRTGAIKTCTVDNRGRDILCDWSDSTPDVSRTYDTTGRMLTMNSSVSALTFTYDDAGQLLSETQNVAGLGAKTVAFTYDADGNRATMTTPGGSVVSTSYTARNQVAAISEDGPPPVATFTYDLAGNRLTKTLENGTQALYAYNGQNYLNDIRHRKVSGDETQLQASYGLFYSGGMQQGVFYDTTGNQGLFTSGGELAFYDAAQQLTSMEVSVTNDWEDYFGDWSSWTYDQTGNRLSKLEPADYSGMFMQSGNISWSTTARNNLNQYTTRTQFPGLGGGNTAQSFGYDTNGNLTSGPASFGLASNSASDPNYYNPTAVSWTYTYDAQNRLTSATQGTRTMTFAYDGRNRCVKRTVTIAGTTTTSYQLYDGWNLIEDCDGSGALVARYVHGPNVDELLMKVEGTQTVYYHEDRLGSVTHLTDASGTVVERYRYNPFGSPFIRNGEGWGARTESAYNNRFLYTGREWLAKIGLYDYRNRAYSPNLGRFMQPDPIGFDAGDVNIYRYVGNSAVNAKDPEGLVINPIIPGTRPGPGGEWTYDESCNPFAPRVPRCTYTVTCNLLVRGPVAVFPVVGAIGDEVTYRCTVTASSGAPCPAVGTFIRNETRTYVIRNFKRTYSYDLSK